MKNIIKAFFLLFTLISCEGEEVDINDLINDNSSSIKYIIEGMITNNSSKHHIILSKPGRFGNDSEIEGVSGAAVQVSDGSQIWNYSELPPIDTEDNSVFSHINPTIYESDEYFSGVEGKTYTLKVVIDGTTYTAQEKMPVASVAYEDELSILKKTSSNSIFGQDKSSIWSNQEVDRERESIKLLSPSSSLMRFFDRIEPEGILGTDTGFGSGFFVNNTSVIRKYSITDTFAEYRWAYLSESEWQGIAFSTEPGQLPTFFNTPEVSGSFSVISGKSYDFDGNSLTLRTIRLFEEQSSYSATYDEGEFIVSFSATGQCILQGLNQSMTGAYEILNNQWVTMYFPVAYNDMENPSVELYRFYKLKIQGAIELVPDSNFYQGGRPGFEYINETSLKSADSIIWE